MMPGPYQIIACPKCKGLQQYRTLASGNTFGTRLWTDGKRIARMLPLPPAVVKCPHQIAKNQKETYQNVLISTESGLE